MTQTSTTPPVQKHLTKDVVFHAAMLLIGTQGKTTSLDVKNHLRSIGYWAKQLPISEFLKELQVEHSWKREDVNGHWEYSDDNTQPVAQNTSALADEIMDLIVDTIGCDDDIELSDNLATDLGIDHLDQISIAVAIDTKFGIQSAKEDWSKITTVAHVVSLVESLGVNVTPPAQPFNSPVAVTNVQFGKTRKKRAVINDSLNPSTSGRVTINIDIKTTTTEQDIQGQIDSNAVSKEDWYVYAVNQATIVNNPTVVYDQKYTSDNVRTAFARLQSVKFQDVRAKRVKHI